MSTWKRNGATCVVDTSTAVMTSPTTGTHSLHRTSEDSATWMGRVRAHWSGFVENQPDLVREAMRAYARKPGRRNWQALLDAAKNDDRYSVEGSLLYLVTRGPRATHYTRFNRAKGFWNLRPTCSTPR